MSDDDDNATADHSAETARRKIDPTARPTAKPTAKPNAKPNAKPTGTETSAGKVPAKLSDRFSAVLGVFGEALITVGAIVLLFLVWQLYINNAVLAGQQVNITQEQSLAWASASPSLLASASPIQTDFGPPPLMTPVGEGRQFGILYIPRLGPDSQRAVRNGVDPISVLNHGFFGHYPDSQWPGQPGNFAMAIHRTGWGSSFADSPKLQAGDKMYLETADGYYIYTFRNHEYVLPTAVKVVLPVPGSQAAPAGQMLITLTTCNPLLGDAERMISYGVFESWRPRSAGPPPAIAAVVAKEAK